jgi:arylsulfatase A-like enzyme
LSAAYVGALGNTWIHTPAFDRLAAESIVFDRAMIDSPAIAETYRSYWTGEPAWLTAQRDALSELTLAQFCHRGAMPTVLITDDDELAAHSLSTAFDEIIRLPPQKDLKQATDWQNTELARFFAAAVELITERSPPALVWLHTAALGRLWDSPQTLRDQYCAEDDPPAAPLVEPPSQAIAGDIDPDVLLGLRHAYAGEVTVLDYCVGTLLNSINGSNWSDALLLATASRGYPLGEHGIVGRAADDLYSEALHVPWFIRVPGGPKYGARRQDLVQPADLFPTLHNWLAPSEPDTTAEPRPWYRGHSLLRCYDGAQPMRRLAVARAKTGETALATPAWFVRAPAPSAPAAAASAQPVELYVKPDDRFEANEVSDRCLGIVDEFRELLQILDAGLQQGVAPELTVSDALTFPSGR